MNSRALQMYGDCASGDDPGTHARVDMLLEVDFKWLMAGQGWLVDPDRLKTDPEYADSCLQFAEASGNDSLQACADCLRALNVCPTGGPARGS